MLNTNRMLVLLCSFMIVLTGCGKQETIERTKVEGMVTLNGKPIQKGVITFIPSGKGASAGANIESGAYAIKEENGPSPGDYRVEIDSSIPTGKKIMSTDGETEIDEFKNAIPEKYNRNSELKVTLEQGNNQYAFDLESK